MKKVKPCHSPERGVEERFLTFPSLMCNKLKKSIITWKILGNTIFEFTSDIRNSMLKPQFEGLFP